VAEDGQSASTSEQGGHDVLGEAKAGFSLTVIDGLVQLEQRIPEDTQPC
jgi:hypothetical protein